MNIAPNLQTDRLALAPIELIDFIFFWRLVGNKSVRQFLGGTVPWRRRFSQFRQYLRGHPKVGIWVVKPHKQKTAIGLIVLSPHKDGAGYEVSYEFHPASWGQGLACEATACVVDHAISDLGLQKVIAETQSENAASCRMLKRLGFTEENRLERFGAQQIIYSKSK